MEIDSIHFYVENASQMRDWSISKLGLQVLANRDELPGRSILVNDKNTTTYHVGNDRLRTIVSSPTNRSSPVADYLDLHPPGVTNIAFWVDNLAEIRQRVDRLGVKIMFDAVTTFTIQGWGTLEHTISQIPIIENEPMVLNSVQTDALDRITGIDHLVLNVPAGELTAAVTWYRDIFDFRVNQSFFINTNRSGLYSQALISSCGKIRFNINEPSSPNSQIQEFLDFNRGAGIQHIALHTNNIFQTVDRLKQQGLEFLPIPQTYYTDLKLRDEGQIESFLTSEEIIALERLQILVDRSTNSPEALLLQIFTKPIFDRPTFFFEIIERRNRAQGFGEGNFQALFEAIERHNAQLMNN
jgi:4-hydroxyphenylpyruvate dioxygenase